MTERIAPLRYRRPVATVVMLLALHGVIVFALVMLAVSVALSIGGPTIGHDELYRMGPALQLSVAGAVAPFILATALTLPIGLAAPSRLWLVPTVATCASVVFCVIAMLLFHAPAPIPGG
ncbi:hypothetical protein ABH923_000289 [Leifsonia sp. EB41]|uniref:hypothetical protein n=1 Tax=Leifsonia sp. EB41 TaxID=3156260 RepID=UPI003515E458